MKEKKVLNGEQIRRKEEKNFSLGLMIGLGLFIIFMVATNNNFGEWIPFSLNYKVTNTPSVFKYQENQGREYQEFYSEYEKFINEIDAFNLDELKGDDFKDNDDYYTYSDDNYNYVESNENCNTNIEGIFVAGDVKSKKIRQLTTAVNDGTIAALEAIEYIDKLK